MRFWLLIGALFLIVLSLLLVAAGWSIRTARIGGVWGLALALGVLGFGGTLGSAGLRGSNHPELWWLRPFPCKRIFWRPPYAISLNGAWAMISPRPW